MTTQRLRWPDKFIVAVIVVIYLAGCSPLSLSPGAATSSATVASMPSASLPSVTLTLTSRPATTTSSPTHTPAPPTVTPRPTLTADERYDFVKEMLETNGGCELPCWWGITPGETTWRAARDFFTSQGINWFYESELYFDPPLSKRTTEYNLDLHFTQRAGIVYSVQVHSQALGAPQVNHFAQDWHRYSPDQLLSKYGIPSQVYIHMMPPIERDAPVYYTLWLVYDQVGFFIIYRGPASYEPPTMRACPRFKEVTWILLYLESPGLSRLFDSSADPPVTLEEATGMSVESFYETFKNPDSDVCIESPANIWP